MRDLPYICSLIRQMNFHMHADLPLSTCNNSRHEHDNFFWTPQDVGFWYNSRSAIIENTCKILGWFHLHLKFRINLIHIPIILKILYFNKYFFKIKKQLNFCGEEKPNFVDKKIFVHVTSTLKIAISEWTYNIQ